MYHAKPDEYTLVLKEIRQTQKTFYHCVTTHSS